jgi:hypothetical protein
MVDWNNEKTISTPSSDIVRVLILQARANLFEAIEFYQKEKLRGVDSDVATIRARLLTYFLELQAGIKRRWWENKDNKAQYGLLYNEIYGNNQISFERIIEIACLLNEELDHLTLIRIDNKKRYDSTRVEVEDEMKGL